MKILKKLLSISFMLFLLNACSKNIELYPQTLDQNSTLDENRTIVLLGITGGDKVNYLQFCEHSCNNFTPKPFTNGIIALRTKSPMEYYSLNSFVMRDSPYSPMTTGSFFYKTAASQAIIIKEPGIYFYGILDTNLRVVTMKNKRKYIELAKEKYGEKLKSLKPINFKW